MCVCCVSDRICIQALILFGGVAMTCVLVTSMCILSVEACVFTVEIRFGGTVCAARPYNGCVCAR